MFKYTSLSFKTTILAAITIATYWLLPLNDPDYFWHLKTGELIYNSQAIPSSDPFSFTMYGEKWVLHEWLFQLFIFVTNNTLGEHGIRILVLSSIVATLYFSHAAATNGEKNKNTSLILILLAALTLMPFMTPRPQIASYLFFSYYLYAIHLTITTKQVRQLLPLPFIMIIWVNLHGGYLIGIILLSLVTITSWLNSKHEAPHSSHEGFTRHFALATLLTLLASAINPDFIYHWKYPFDVLSLKATSHISEWHSPDFKLPLMRLFLVFVMLFVLSFIYSKQRPSIGKIITPMFFIAIAFISARNIPFAIISMIVFFPNLNEIDSRPFQCISHPFGIVKKKYHELVSTSPDIGKKEYTLNWILLTLIAIIIPLADFKISTSYDSFPHQAINHFIEKNLQGNILSEYRNGGYLIDRLYPSSRVFIDGRADMYGDKVFSDYLDIMGGAENWEALFNSYQINYIICENDAAIRQLLLHSPDFKLLYKDEHYSIIENLRNTIEWNKENRHQ